MNIKMPPFKQAYFYPDIFIAVSSYDLRQGVCVSVFTFLPTLSAFT